MGIFGPLHEPKSIFYIQSNPLDQGPLKEAFHLHLLPKYCLHSLNDSEWAILALPICLWVLYLIHVNPQKTSRHHQMTVTSFGLDQTELINCMIKVEEVVKELVEDIKQHWHSKYFQIEGSVPKHSNSDSSRGSGGMSPTGKF